MFKNREPGAISTIGSTSLPSRFPGEDPMYIARVCHQSVSGGGTSYPERDARTGFVIANPKGEAIQGFTGFWIASRYQ
ncbi:MAG: hypothetical protein LBP56_03855 [Odoribacteraceae bacterium]|nr:hypothetical protein [Odoribacteraceae bacterium]